MTGYVYAIGNDQLVKVGWSNNPRRRLGEIRCASPSDWKLFGFFDGTIEDEQCLHKIFHQWRVGGEWFHRQELVEQFIEVISFSPAQSKTISMNRSSSLEWTLDDGHRLRMFRLNQSLSQETMAERLGCSQETLSRIERGRPPSKSVWLLIQAITRVPA